ncbi:hypothetical protein PV11_07149 [Exophiala sideris]|uniref:Uncharacterized protein n=1 Tax=Exophiala sideris TaxID=1016849 RepID=A0A0D1YXT4_9EURO|nr:hypothetical protein PV11_07149 [Exophiala sideris]
MNRTPPGIALSMSSDDGMSPMSIHVHTVSTFGYDSMSRHAGSSLQSSPPNSQMGHAFSGTMEEQPKVPDEHTNTYQDHLFNQLLARITQNPDIAYHRDAACKYLALEQELWVALFRPRWPSEAQQMLGQYLAQEYGVLPASLWLSLLAVRKDPHFELFQEPFVHAVSGMSVSQTNSTPGSDISLHAGTLPGVWAGTSTLEPWHARDDRGASQSSTTMLGSVFDRRPSAAAPIPTVRCRRTSPGTRTAGGRAPAGYKYFCPEPGCQRADFRNAGNYRNHVRLYHPHLPEHDPADALRPDRPPDQDELWSSAVIPGDTPLHSRTPSVDLGPVDGMMTVVRPDGNLDGRAGFPGSQADFLSTLAYENALPRSTFERDVMSAEYQGNPRDSSDSEHYFGLERGLVSETGLSFGMFQETLQQRNFGSSSSGRQFSRSESSDSRQ